MSVPTSWFLATNFDTESILEFVRTIPNAGLTERIDGVWADVYLDDRGEVVVEPADVEAFGPELERGNGGDISYSLSSAVELCACICVETPTREGRSRYGLPAFRNYACKDLALEIGAIRGMIRDGYDDEDGGRMVGALLASMERALELHIAVIFGR